MRARTLLNIMIAIMAVSPVIVALGDNDIEAPDMPWEEDGGDSTAVATVSADDPSEAEHSPIYDLQGRRVTNPQPGRIYIIAGKKVVWNR